MTDQPKRDDADPRPHTTDHLAWSRVLCPHCDEPLLLESRTKMRVSPITEPPAAPGT